MTNKLVNFKNGTLDCYSDSIIKFREFLIEDAEKQIKSFGDNYKYKSILDEILEKIKNTKDDFKNLKDYFNSRKNRKLVILPGKKLYKLFEEEINNLKFSELYFDNLIFLKDNYLLKEEIDPKEYDGLSFFIEKKDKTIFMRVNIIIQYFDKIDNREIYDLKIYDGKLDEIDTIKSSELLEVDREAEIRDNFFEIINKEIQKQIIESEEYGEYLKTFLK